MPRRNGMGPLGLGRMTGRGLGTCCDSAGAGFRHRGENNSGHVAGRPFGKGLGVGRRNNPVPLEATPLPAESQEENPTVVRMDAMQQQLDDIRKQIADLIHLVRPEAKTAE
ncbi:MAG: DUF5320 domain-containing protein [Candidatus Ozemobacteraceae bacterium]